MKNIIEFYGADSTAKGFINFYDSVFQDLDKIYSLKSATNQFKTETFKNLIDLYSEKYTIEVVRSSLDNKEIEGFIIRDLKLGVVNGSLVHGAKIESKDVNLEEIDLQASIDKTILEETKLQQLTEDFQKNLNISKIHFEEALKIHDKWEVVYISNMNFDKANILSKDISYKLIPKKNSTKVGRAYHRYLGGATPEGAKDTVPSLTAGLKRYFIKGRPGTSKSTMLKNLFKNAVENGYDVEVYHCGFDPDSLDMIIIRELSFAIFDSTAPHEYFPDREDDEVIDTYKELVNEGTDEKNKDILNKISKEYKYNVALGVNHLIQCKNLKDQIDSIYEKAFNEKEADEILKNKLYNL